MWWLVVGGTYACPFPLLYDTFRQWCLARKGRESLDTLTEGLPNDKAT